MGRYGISPARGRTTSYRPAQVTACVLTYIPELEGFYRHRMEVLRVCLESLIANTKEPYDLLVFDNGSCAEAVDYLQSLKRDGKIDILLLSAKNLGKIGALQVMFHAAPGELVAYCDDDILFYPRWLGAQLTVYDTFPKAGLVSGSPVRNAVHHASESNRKFVETSPPGLQVSQGRWIPEEWERDWAISTGRDPEKYLAETKDQLDVRLTFNGVDAYPAANHFQYLAPKEVLVKALPEDWTGQLMGHMIELEEAIDRQGVLRLSTTERYVRHLGNVVSGEIAGEARLMGIDVESKSFSRRENHRWIYIIPGMRRVLNWIYGKLYELLYDVR
jgi:glycosyltransferase involved in cell wall biosynthesis